MPRRALKVCACTTCPAHPGSCPTLVPAGRCAPCAGQRDQARGSRQTRGYDAGHDALRRTWQQRIDAGQHVQCTNPVCLAPTRTIHRGDRWDLGHDEQRRHRGPEHRACNRSAAGRAAHGG